MKYLFLAFIAAFNLYGMEVGQKQVDSINSWFSSKQTDSTYNCQSKFIAFESSAMCITYGTVEQKLPSGAKITIDRNKEALIMIAETVTIFGNKKLFFSNPLASNLNLTSSIFNADEREEITLEAYVRHLKRNYKPGEVKAVFVSPTVNGNRYVPGKILFGQTQVR